MPSYHPKIGVHVPPEVDLHQVYQDLFSLTLGIPLSAHVHEMPRFSHLRPTGQVKSHLTLGSLLSD